MSSIVLVDFGMKASSVTPFPIHSVSGNQVSSHLSFILLNTLLIYYCTFLLKSMNSPLLYELMFATQITFEM